MGSRVAVGKAYCHAIKKKGDKETEDAKKELMLSVCEGRHCFGKGE